MLGKKTGKQAFDFEFNARKVIEGTNKERRWRGQDKGGLVSRTRRLIAVGMEKHIGLLTSVKCFVDSWRSTPESVTEHSFKQTLLMIRMLLIEQAKGDPEIFKQLDCTRLLTWAILHDLAEGHPDFYDMPHLVKHQSVEFRNKIDIIEAGVMAEILESLFTLEYKELYSALPVGRIDPNKSLAEQPNEVFWKSSEHIGFNFFMLEEIQLGKISRKRRVRFHDDVMYRNISWVKENAWHFASVREIVEREQIPKWLHVSGNV